MLKIVVASKNVVKQQATLQGFQKMFPDTEFEIEGVSAASGVSDQPMTDEETFTGAMNRVQNARDEAPNADFWIGIEGGIDERNGEMLAFAWVVVQSAGGVTAKSKTSTFFLPPKVAELVRQGKELGEADDIVFQRQNSKQKNGAIGILTHDVIDRTRYYAEAVVLALIPFRNIELYPPSGA